MYVTAIICAIKILAANDFSSKQEVIAYAVVTALSMIASSLVVVLIITMTVGTKRKVKRHVIVCTLNSLEALGRCKAAQEVEHSHGWYPVAPSSSRV